MQSFTTDMDCPCQGRLKLLQQKYRWCLSFDAVYILIIQYYKQLFELLATEK